MRIVLPQPVNDFSTAPRFGARIPMQIGKGGEFLTASSPLSIYQIDGERVTGHQLVIDLSPGNKTRPSKGGVEFRNQPCKIRGERIPKTLLNKLYLMSVLKWSGEKGLTGKIGSWVECLLIQGDKKRPEEKGKVVVLTEGDIASYLEHHDEPEAGHEEVPRPRVPPRGSRSREQDGLDVMITPPLVGASSDAAAKATTVLNRVDLQHRR